MGAEASKPERAGKKGNTKTQTTPAADLESAPTVDLAFEEQIAPAAIEDLRSYAIGQKGSVGSTYAPTEVQLDELNGLYPRASGTYSRRTSMQQTLKEIDEQGVASFRNVGPPPARSRFVADARRALHAGRASASAAPGATNSMDARRSLGGAQLPPPRGSLGGAQLPPPPPRSSIGGAQLPPRQPAATPAADPAAKLAAAGAVAQGKGVVAGMVHAPLPTKQVQGPVTPDSDRGSAFNHSQHLRDSSTDGAAAVTITGYNATVTDSAHSNVHMMNMNGPLVTIPSVDSSALSPSMSIATPGRTSNASVSVQDLTGQRSSIAKDTMGAAAVGTATAPVPASPASTAAANQKRNGPVDAKLVANALVAASSGLKRAPSAEPASTSGLAAMPSVAAPITPTLSPAASQLTQAPSTTGLHPTHRLPSSGSSSLGGSEASSVTAAAATPVAAAPARVASAAAPVSAPVPAQAAAAPVVTQPAPVQNNSSPSPVTPPSAPRAVLSLLSPVPFPLDINDKDEEVVLEESVVYPQLDYTVPIDADFMKLSDLKEAAIGKDQTMEEWAAQQSAGSVDHHTYTAQLPHESTAMHVTNPRFGSHNSSSFTPASARARAASRPPPSSSLFACFGCGGAPAAEDYHQHEVAEVSPSKRVHADAANAANKARKTMRDSEDVPWVAPVSALAPKQLGKCHTNRDSIMLNYVTPSQQYYAPLAPHQQEQQQQYRPLTATGGGAGPVCEGTEVVPTSIPTTTTTTDVVAAAAGSLPAAAASAAVPAPGEEPGEEGAAAFAPTGEKPEDIGTGSGSDRGVAAAVVEPVHAPPPPLQPVKEKA